MTTTTDTKAAPPRSIIARIDDLEAEVASLKKAREDRPSASSPKACSRNLVRPLSPACKEIALLAWDTLEVGEEGVTLSRWYDAIRALVGDARMFPAFGGFLGATLRAILAERAGLRIRWSGTPLLGEGEVQ